MRSRRQRTEQAILRATLGIILSGEQVTKSAICRETPCSPATLSRFFPDLEVARISCFLGAAAQEHGAPYFKGLQNSLENNATLRSRLSAIIEVQNAYVHSHLKFIREVARVSMLHEHAADEPARIATHFSRRLSQETLGPQAPSDDVKLLDAQLQQIIGYNAMLNCYQVAMNAGVSYRDHCEQLCQSVLSHLGKNTSASPRKAAAFSNTISSVKTY